MTEPSSATLVRVIRLAILDAANETAGEVELKTAMSIADSVASEVTQWLYEHDPSATAGEPPRGEP